MLLLMEGENIVDGEPRPGGFVYVGFPAKNTIMAKGFYGNKGEAPE